MVFEMRGSRWLRRPVVHFVLVGAALFVVGRWWSARDQTAALPDRKAPIVIDSERIARLRDELTRRLGAPPTREQERALIDQEIDEELLYREALARGLERDDSSVRAWLINKMRFVSDDPDQSDDELHAQALALGLDRDDIVVRRILAQKMRLLAEHSGGRVEPSEEELRAYFLANQEVWTRPERVSFWHVFLSRDRHGEGLEPAANALLEDIRARGPADTNDVGDPFPLGRHHRARSSEDIERVFGGGFADRVMQLPPGSWQGPVASAYGLHLVYVEEKLPIEPASLESVQNQVSRRFAAERREDQLSRVLSRLRGEYEIRVEESEASSAS